MVVGNGGVLKRKKVMMIRKIKELIQNPKRNKQKRNLEQNVNLVKKKCRKK